MTLLCQLVKSVLIFVSVHLFSCLLLDRPTYLSDLPRILSFFLFSFFFLSFFIFCHVPSKFTERNSIEIGHMLGSNCDLKTHVQNLGYLFPYKSGAQKPPIWTTSQLNGNFNVLYLQNKTPYRQSAKCVDNHQGSPASSRNVMNFGPQTASNWTAILPTYVNSAFYVIVRLRRRISANRTQPHFAKRRMVNRANNVL